MRDYEELVERLRSVKDIWQSEEEQWMLDAADSIEELQKRVELEYQSGFADGQRAANRKKNKWISVEEWPTKNVCDDDYTGYLVFSDGYIKVADYTCGFYVDGEYDPNVTHYMPLPKPPKESANDSR